MLAQVVEPRALSQTMDARVWAAAFIVAQAAHGPLDEATMQTWFASAIMCGWDHPARQAATEDAPPDD